MTDTLHVLRAARELLTDEARWCRAGHAIDAGGLKCVPWSMDAVAWSLNYSVLAVALDKKVHRPAETRRTAREVIGDVVSDWHHSDAESWNNNPDTTHADVLAVLDEAIGRVAA